MSTAQSFIPEPVALPEQLGQSYPVLVRLMQRLLAPGGCPWDREQTPESLRRYVLEEACEVIDAIEDGGAAALCEELGDLALQVVFLGELCRTLHGFGPDDVLRGICEKLVRRHPHVFGGSDAQSAEEVITQWEAIKAKEKPRSEQLLGRVPRALPALQRAAALGSRAAKVGFDWEDAQGVRAKLNEELGELDQALGEDKQRAEAELGDVLFAAVNLARHHGLDPAAALSGACDRFTRRFGHVEKRVKQEHGDWPRSTDGEEIPGISSTELERYWQEAKRQEKSP